MDFADNYSSNLKKVNYLVLDFRKNPSLKHHYLYDHRVLLNNDDYYVKDTDTWVSIDINFFVKVPLIIKDLLNFDNNYLIMNIVKIPPKLS